VGQKVDCGRIGARGGPGVLKGKGAYFEQLARADEEGEAKAAFLPAFLAPRMASIRGQGRCSGSG